MDVRPINPTKAETDGPEFTGFVSELNQFCFATLVTRRLDFASLAFRLRQRLVIGHFHDDPCDRLTGDLFDRRFNRFVQYRRG